MFFIGQNLKHVHMRYSFKYLLFGVYFSLNQINTAYKYNLQRKPFMKEMQIDTHFYLSLILM